MEVRSGRRHVCQDAFIGLVCVLAAALLAIAWTQGSSESFVPLGAGVLFIAMLVTERLSVSLPRSGEVAISTIPHMMAILLLPCWLTMSLAGAAMLIDQLFARAPLRRVTFNIASIMVTTGVAAFLARALDLQASTLGRIDDWQQLPAFLLVAATYYLLTSLLVSSIVALSTGTPVHRAFLDNALFSVPAEFAVCGIGGLLALVWVLSPFWTPLVLFPAIISQIAIKYIATANQKSDALRHQARHDVLTGLPNRSMLTERLDVLLNPAVDGLGFSLLLLDLDRFKDVNDTFGHHHGDLLLREVGGRIKALLRPVDLLARQGGDEFALLLPGLDQRAALVVAEAVLRAVELPFSIDEHEFQVGGSIGVAAHPPHGNTAEELLSHADIAMYAAKRDHLGTIVYSPNLDDSEPARVSLYGELRRAIEQDELVLYFQPKLDLQTGLVGCVEALVRWSHPTRGLLPPDQFIPFAERTGLIKPLGLWVLTAAMRQCRAWRDEGLHLAVAVNLTAADLQDEALPNHVALVLADLNLPTSCLCVEITESTFMADQTRAQTVLGALRLMGVRVAIDDFGTGYSSLAYLKHLPADEVKIDRTFIHEIATDRADAAIVRSIIALSHDLGLAVTAEGIEDAQSLERLRQLGCDEVQGYLVSRPLNSAALVAWISRDWHEDFDAPTPTPPTTPTTSRGRDPVAIRRRDWRRPVSGPSSCPTAR